MAVNKDELIEKCKSNDRKAQHTLYRHWFPVLMKVAYRYKRNEEDAAASVNLAFYKVFTNIKKYQSSYSFEGWIKRILMNILIDEYRKEKKTNELIVTLEEEAFHDIEKVEYDYLEKELKVERAEQMLNRLPLKEQMVFNLYEIDGYSHKEIVEIVGISERSSKRYLSHARETLKSMVLHFTKTVNIVL